MKTYKKFLAFAMALCSISTAAKAGGYQLNEYSVTSLGRSFAGVGIVGDDYSAIAFNPAGMSLMNKSGMQVGATVVNLQADVDKLGGGSGDLKVTVPVPSFFGQYKVNDKIDVGLGVYAPFGLATRYKADWAGSDYGILSKLDIIDVSPAISYKINSQWSIGGSFILRYIYGHMTNTVAIPGMGRSKSDFELDGWTVAGNLGVVYQPTKDSRLGLSWRSGSTQQVKGDHKMEGLIRPVAAYNGTYTGRASPDLPQIVTFSAYDKIGNFGLSASARWTEWSESFPRFIMKSENPMFGGKAGIASKTDYNWKNSWSISGGLDYYYNQNWTFRAGTCWDESPARKANERTVRIPDTDRIWLSAGFSYITENFQYDVGYARMFGKTAKVLEPDGTEFKYKKMRANLLGVQMQYKF